MAHRSVKTIKADAARRWFQAEGEGIVWAVLSSGIDGEHAHFRRHRNLDLQPPLQHRDFTVPEGEDERPLVDEHGHGTYVAGLVAGEMSSADGPMIALEQVLDQDPEATKGKTKTTLTQISGVAPKTKLLSLKVLGATGQGKVSKCLQAFSYIDKVNQYGRRLLVHGVNMSLGYDYDPRLFACGQSPLCIAINRLVNSGVVVVASAGNAGYVNIVNSSGKAEARGFSLSITDPGNAELAITVGSTHRDQPLLYGVSYYSSRGPTLDGRLKPDLVAPGEYIVGPVPKTAEGNKDVDFSGDPERSAYYLEQSGTSGSAAHVSGAAAALLSVRRELIGRPAEIKSTLMSTATDLRRHVHFQGAGLVDVLRAIFPSGVAAVPSHDPHFREPSAIAAASEDVGVGIVSAAAPDIALPTSDTPPSQNRTAPSPPRPLRLMISYSRKDEELKNALMTHLSALARGRSVDVWQDRELLPGAEFGPEIARQLDDANIIVLLVSADFIASDYCYRVEMKRAIQRHKKGTARVIPVILRSADWMQTPLKALNALPTDGKPVTKWEDTDEAWLNVAQGIRAAVQEMRRSR